MALEVEEAFPSFSTERIRSKVQLRDGPATQRRLDYNAPLLSVRRLIDVGGHVRSKVWKLSGELSKEPLGEAGGVPFTWEHIPGQPKQPESPLREPSSPSPPSTPSPPSSRRASPASPTVPPPPPPLRPVFLRSNSSTLFAPPPPPPPPPPPLPLIHPLPLSVRRIVPHAKRPPSSSASPAPPPPPPPPPPPLPPPSTFSQASKQASKTLVSQRLPDHERMGAFRLVDPTDGFLRVLRARREKAEPQEFLIHDAAEEAAEVSHKAAGEGSITAVASGRDKSSCVAVDAIVQRFLAEHPDAATEEEASVERQDDQALQEDDQARVDTVNSVDLPCGNSKHDTEKGKEVIDDASNHCGIIVSKEDAAYIPELQVPCSDVASEETQRCESKVSDGFTTEYVPLPTQENGGSMCAPISPSMDHREVQLEAGHKQSVIRKQQNTRCTSNIAILDSCRVESLQMIRSTLLQFCRKAATASIRTFARAKRKVYASGCTSSSLDVVVVPSNANRTINEGCSDRGEDTVAREEKAIVQEQFPQETHRQEALVSIPNGLPIILPRSSTDVLQERPESNPCDEINTDTKRGCTPISSPKSSTESSPLRENNEAEKKDIVSSSTHHTWSAKRGNLPVSSPKSPSENSPCLETSDAEKKEVIPSPPHYSPDAQDSPALHPSEQEERLELRPRVSSIRHVYAKSFGGDEPNEFYDASSRFGSRGSTPTRLFSNRSMSKDWSIPDDFLDATSSPFETPRTSVSDIRYTFSNAELAGFSPSTASRMGSTTRQTSKLSKRVGKALWVDTRETNATGKSSWVDRGEINAAGKVDAKSCDKLKGFMSGELYPTSKESEQVLNKKEMNGTRRKYVSGDQASTSTADARREYKRDIALRRSTGKSIAVTPVFPSKCQKNRSIASASGLPQQISTVDISEMGWPLGISGFPPLKINTKVKERKERGATKGEGNMVVPLPPLPASPAGGSWLMKALSTSIQKQTPPGLASMNADAKKGESSPRPGNKWEDIVKGSHIQPGHLRFSEELHHHPPSNSTSTKYYAS